MKTVVRVFCFPEDAWFLPELSLLVPSFDMNFANIPSLRAARSMRLEYDL